jgi:hypothetical protein
MSGDIALGSEGKGHPIVTWHLRAVQFPAQNKEIRAQPSYDSPFAVNMLKDFIFEA